MKIVKRHGAFYLINDNDAHLGGPYPERALAIKRMADLTAKIDAFKAKRRGKGRK